MNKKYLLLSSCFFVLSQIIPVFGYYDKLKSFITIGLLISIFFSVISLVKKENFILPTLLIVVGIFMLWAYGISFDFM